jgi:PAS domain S-box-containing protein
MSEPKQAGLLLEIQRDLAVDLCRATDLVTAFRQLLAAAMRLPGFDCGGVYARDPDSGALELLFHHGISEEFSTQAKFHAAGSPQAGLARSGKLIYAARDELPPAVAAGIAGEGLTTLAIVPLKSEGLVVGVINVSSHQHERIDSESRIALESLAAQAEGVIALIHAREARHRAEEHLRLAVEGADLGVWVADFDADFVDCSPRTRALAGIPPDLPLAADGPMAFIHPDDRQMAADALRRVLDGGEPLHCEFRTLADPGRWLAAQARLFDDSGAKRLYGTLRDISRRKLAEAELLEARDRLEWRVAQRTAELEAASGILYESEEKYRTLHESMMDAYARVDMAGRLLESNRAFREMVGYTEEELSHLSYVDLTPEKWHAFEARVLAEQILPCSGSETYEKEYRRKDGSVFPVELRTFLLRDRKGEPASMWAIVRDITARKQAEREVHEWNERLEQRVAERTLALAESEARFRLLAETTFEGVAITEDGIMRDCNPQLGALLGYTVEEIRGRPVLDLIAPESRALVRRHIREGYEQPYEFTSLRKDGSTFLTEAHGRNRNLDGRETRVTALRDLTAVKQAAEQIQAQRVQLEQAQRLALTHEISAGVMHQIVQPLTAVTNHAAIARLRASRGELPANEVLEMLGKIENELGGVRQTIGRIRALAHPGDLFRGRICPTDLLRGLGDLLRDEAMAHGFETSVDCAADLPAVEMDRVQIEQVVVNLARNAFEAGAALAPDRRVLRISTRAAGKRGVELRVSDRGPGIAPDSQALLFTPFFTTKPGGTGIGLHLCRTIISAHGGIIEGFNNPDGPGATFRFTLPAAPAVAGGRAR